MSDGFSVKSHRRDYRVEFVGDACTSLAAELRDGDCLIIDAAVEREFERVAALANKHPHLVIEASESAKTYDAIGQTIGQLIERGLTRQSRLVAVGGGVTQDLTAFIASVFKRGVQWLFVPTTLLTQCDSCIGSKTSVNFGRYKNQLGTFYPPSTIYIDSAFLATLPERQLRAGLGEMLHYFLVSSEDDFARAEAQFDRALTDLPTLGGLIRRSLEIKKAMVEIDEFDVGPRNVFNYGHSFGHALEAATNNEIPHGTAVAYGMDLANVLSADLGLVAPRFRERVRPTLAKSWQVTPLPTFSMDDFGAALSRDKKNVGTERKVILTRGFGDMFKTTLPRTDAIESRMQAFFADQLYNRAL